MKTAEAIREYFARDHDRLDDLFKQFQALKRSDYPKAKGFFKAFKIGLQRHIVWEEDILFPLFEGKTGLTGGPTDIMRMEHRQIKKHLEEIHDKVRIQYPESDEAEQALLYVLSLHNNKEEKVLYPAIDQHMTDQDRADVFAAMEKVPEERYHRCC